MSEPAIKTRPATREYRDNWDRTFGAPLEPGCGICGELVGCICDDHDPACERLCTEGADCNCGDWRGDRR